MITYDCEHCGGFLAYQGIDYSQEDKIADKKIYKCGKCGNIIEEEIIIN